MPATREKNIRAPLPSELLLYKRIIESIDLGLVYVDNNDIILYINDRFCKLVGYSRKELIGKVASKKLVSNQSKRIIKEKIKKRKKGDSDEYEIFLKTKSGTDIAIYIYGFPVKDNSGKVIGSMGIHKDISRKKTEEKIKKLNQEQAERVIQLEALNQEIKSHIGQLQENDKKFAKIFEESPVGISIAKLPSGIFVDVNKRFLQMFGFSRQEAIGHTSLQLNMIDANEREKIRQEVIQGKSIRDKEIIVNKKTGEKFIILISITHFRLGKEDYAITLSNDITEKKEAAEKILAAEKRFRSIIENNRDIITLTDEKFAPIYRSPSAEQITGYTLKEVLKINALEQIHPDDAGQVKTIMKEVLVNPGKPIPAAFRMKHKAGHYIWLEGTINNLLNDPNVNAIVSNIRDVTEKLEAFTEVITSEKKLNELSQRLLLATSSAKIGIFEWDMVSNKLTWDENMYSLFGVGSDEKTDPIEIATNKIHPDDKNRIPALIQAALKNNEDIHFEIRILWPNGETRYNEVHAIIIKNKEEQPARMIGVNWNVTKQKRIEEKLIKSEAQAKRYTENLHLAIEEERTRIAREIHDELGQQLTGIKLGLSSFQKFGHVDNKIEKRAAGMMKDVEQAMQTLRRISTELRPRILDTLGLIPSIGWLVKEFEKNTGIKCNTNLSISEQVFEKNTSLPCLAAGGPDRQVSTCYFRICQEALTNIVKHAAASEVIIHTYQHNHELVLKISDNGKGIAQDKLENPFAMGLFGMRERAKIIGADLQITSIEGKGTTIQLKTNIN